MRGRVILEGFKKEDSDKMKGITMTTPDHRLSCFTSQLLPFILFLASLLSLSNYFFLLLFLTILLCSAFFLLDTQHVPTRVHVTLIDFIIFLNIILVLGINSVSPHKKPHKNKFVRMNENEISFWENAFFFHSKCWTVVSLETHTLNCKYCEPKKRSCIAFFSQLPNEQRRTCLRHVLLWFLY